MIKKRTTGYLMQDVGLVLLLGCILAGAIVVGTVQESLYFESVIMLVAIFAAILLAGFKLTSLAVVVAGAEILIYTAYRLFLYFTYYEEIPLLSYVWIALPMLSAGSMFLFSAGSKQTELENDVLKEQVEELVMINSMTGLYNLRSLYTDISRQIAYAERNKLPLSLMIVQLRYEPELKSVLSRNNYEEMIQRLSIVVVDSVRAEDRCYSIDNKGGLAILLTCDNAGSEFVKNRIRQRVAEKKAFTGIANETIKVEVKIASVQYDKEKFGEDVILFKQKTESELQYDV